MTSFPNFQLLRHGLECSLIKKQIEICGKYDALLVPSDEKQKLGIALLMVCGYSGFLLTLK